MAITVADDGRGFSESGGGTGIGLRNVRERLADYLLRENPQAGATVRIDGR